MKRKKLWIIIGIIILICVFILIYIFKGRSASVDGDSMEEMEVLVQKITKEEISETILVTGEVIPQDEQKVYLDPEHGEIKEFTVKENDKVSKGDTLFSYDTTKIESEYNQAVRSRDLVQNNVKAEENQIAQLAKQIEDLKKGVNVQAPKQEDDADSDDGEEDDVIASTPEDIRSLELEKSQAEIELENTKAELAAAQDEINELEKQKQSLNVKSNIDGIVVKVNKNLERTDEGATEAVIHIVSSKPFKVVGSMSEFDAVKIKPKQKVIIRPKVYKDREWNGKVESVSQFPTDDGEDTDFYGGGEGNVTMYPFTVKITDDTKELRQGFHVSLEVNISGDKKKVAVPHVALMDDMMDMDMEEEVSGGFAEDMLGMGDMEDFEEEGNSFVYILNDGFLERRDVEIGDMSDEFVEIKEGVEPGELVVITPHMDMYDGMEVASYDEIE